MENQSLSVAPPSASPVQPADNRRRYPRFSCEGHAEVCVPHGGLLFRGRILDLSLSGCFIQAPALNMERGTPVEVFFVARQLRFHVAGRIAVMHRRRGAGIAFQDLAPRRIRQIEELVSELQKYPEPVELAPEA
jgi:hypothetical protein